MRPFATSAAVCLDFGRISVPLCHIVPYIFKNLILLSEQSVCCDILYKNELDNRRVASFPFCFARFLFHYRGIQETVSFLKKKKKKIGIKLTTNSTAVVALNC